MRWAEVLKNHLRHARIKGGGGAALNHIEDILTILEERGVTGHGDLEDRLDRRKAKRWGRRGDDCLVSSPVRVWNDEDA